MIERIFLGLLASLLVSPAAIAQSSFTGKAGGAFYNIAVPETWNGTLVIWNHGYSFDPSLADPPSLGPLAGLQLAEGYAVAASSYSQSQWAVFRTTRDLQHLVNVFEEKVGTPDSIIISGGSLGGIVTADALENSNIGNVIGAYPICGVLAGSRVWDGALDVRLTYDAICGDVPGAAIPGGATGLPSQFYPLTEPGMATALHACTGFFAPAAFRTPDQQSRLDHLIASTQLPESFIPTVLGFGVFGIADLIHDRGKLNGRQGMGNVGVVYDDPDVNANIERVAVNPGAARRLADNYRPTGDIGDVKIVSIHTSKDGLVIVENEKEYQDVVNAENLTVAIVAEALPTHCGFTAAELTAGWESLRGWLAGLPQPSAASIQGTCQFLEGAGLAPGPCRIDPAFVIPDMDDRVKPR